jgi:MFS family permease
MDRIGAFLRDLTLKPQGITLVIAAFLPIIAITAMVTAVGPMIGHFASDPGARAAVPALIGAPGLTMAFLAPFAGIAVDRFGRRRLLLLSTALYGVFGTAPFFLDSLDQIYASRLLLGVAEAGILTTVNTLIGDYWDDAKRKNWLFLQGILGPLISAVISVIIGYVAKLQWNGVFLVYLVALPIWFAMYALLFEPRKPDAEPAAQQPRGPKPTLADFPWRSAILIAGVTFFCSMLYYVFILNGALVFADIGLTESDRLGRVIFFPSLFILVGAVLFRLVAHRSNLFQLGLMLALLGGGLAWIGLAASLPMMIAGLVVQQTAAGMAVPTLIAWSQTKFGFEHRGLGMGIWTGAFFLAQSQSPRLVSYFDAQAKVADPASHSMQQAFLTMGSAGLAAGLAALVLVVAMTARKAA